ncbi:YceI family protein [Chryseobacterium sp. MP_3.2]|uniref:YceI family protein n=1 Tax=Chryseobacterium sp. MP_3.2 TaxID=3071712 RepID=UPI002DF9C858|nr:polyisoprenoid-binding protein YceI [Chryseobacterium sp. MP_3.2]
MKKLAIFLVFFLAVNFIFAQKYSTKTGKVHFEASVPLFEDVDATNSTAVTVLNADTGDIAALLMVKNFKFKVALMEEHFNESYAETAKYPKSTFTGKLINFNKDELSAVPKKYNLNGIVNFHGVNNKISSVANVFTQNGKIMITGNFLIKTADFKVKIPKMVMKKIAENVNVDYQFELIKQ